MSLFPKKNLESTETKPYSMTLKCIQTKNYSCRPSKNDNIVELTINVDII